MTPAPAVAVIVPVHGHPELLAETLDSVRRQRGVTVRLVVIDDASPVPVAAQGASVVRLAAKIGPGPARNEGLKFAEGEFVAFLDSDDVWEDDFLERSVAALAKTGASASVALSRPVFSGGFAWTTGLRLRMFTAARNGALRLCAFLSPSGLPVAGFYLCQLSHVLFRTDRIKGLRFGAEIGGEDWSFLLDAMKGGTVTVIPRRLVRYRFRPDSLSFRPLDPARRKAIYSAFLPRLEAAGARGPLLLLYKAYFGLFGGGR